jgi:hypothetical protein
MKKSHFVNLKEIKESQIKIILYKNFGRLQRLEKNLYNEMIKGNQTCAIDETKNFKLLSIKSSC